MAACPHAAIAGQRGPRAQWFRRAGLAGCGRPALRTKSMMHRRGAGTGCEIPGAGGRCSRFRADIKSAPTVWTEVHAVGGVPGPGDWRADVGIGPYEAEPSNLAKIGSRSGRPYRPPLRGNRRRGRRGGLYGRPCAPTCWMHHRRTHPARYRKQKHHRRTYPLWGRVRRWCEIYRAGGRCSRFWADIQSAPTGEEAPIPGENREPVAGGHVGRPYEKARSLFADGDV